MSGVGVEHIVTSRRRNGNWRRPARRMRKRRRSEKDVGDMESER